jgi:hypothetical protein
VNPGRLAVECLCVCVRFLFVSLCIPGVGCLFVPGICVSGCLCAFVFL